MTEPRNYLAEAVQIARGESRLIATEEHVKALYDLVGEKRFMQGFELATTSTASQGVCACGRPMFCIRDGFDSFWVCDGCRKSSMACDCDGRRDAERNVAAAPALAPEPDIERDRR